MSAALRNTADVARALGDETRLRLLMTLADGELCLCQMVCIVGLAPSTVSKHLAVLAQAGLVERRKDGRWHYYRLAGRSGPPAAREALRWARRALDGDASIEADGRCACKTRETDLEELSACYR